MNIFRELLILIRLEAIKKQPKLTLEEIFKIDLKVHFGKDYDVSTNVAMILTQAEKRINNGTG